MPEECVKNVERNYLVGMVTGRPLPIYVNDVSHTHHQNTDVRLSQKPVVSVVLE